MRSRRNNLVVGAADGLKRIAAITTVNEVVVGKQVHTCFCVLNYLLGGGPYANISNSPGGFMTKVEFGILVFSIQTRFLGKNRQPVFSVSNHRMAPYHTHSCAVAAGCCCSWRLFKPVKSGVIEINDLMVQHSQRGYTGTILPISVPSLVLFHGAAGHSRFCCRSRQCQ